MVKHLEMRLRTSAALMVTGFLLLLARPGLAGQEPTARERSTLSDDIGALKRDFLLLLSVGLERAGMRKGASVVSRHLVATAEDPFETCMAQAAFVWQTADAGPFPDLTLKELEKLRGTVSRVGADDRFTPEEKEACRSGYRRVTGDLIYEGMRTTDLGRASLERIRAVFAAYLATVQ